MKFVPDHTIRENLVQSRNRIFNAILKLPWDFAISDPNCSILEIFNGESRVERVDDNLITVVSPQGRRFEFVPLVCRDSLRRYVFKVVDLESKQIFAVKILLSGLLSTDPRDRYDKLKEVLGEINKRGEARSYPRVFAFGISNSSEEFSDLMAGNPVVLVTEYVDGILLERLIEEKKGKIACNNELSEVLEIAKQLLQALVTLDQLKVYHQDIDPSNITVVSEPEGLKVVIHDVDSISPQSEPNDDFAEISAGTILLRIENERIVTSSYPLEYLHRRSIKSDIAAVGTILLRLIAGEILGFEGIPTIKNYEKNLKKVVAKVRMKRLRKPIEEFIRKLIIEPTDGGFNTPDAALKACESLIQRIELSQKQSTQGLAIVEKTISRSRSGWSNIRRLLLECKNRLGDCKTKIKRSLHAVLHQGRGSRNYRELESIEFKGSTPKGDEYGIGRITGGRRVTVVRSSDGQLRVYDKVSGQRLQDVADICCTRDGRIVGRVQLENGAWTLIEIYQDGRSRLLAYRHGRARLFRKTKEYERVEIEYFRTLEDGTIQGKLQIDGKVYPFILRSGGKPVIYTSVDKCKVVGNDGLLFMPNGSILGFAEINHYPESLPRNVRPPKRFFLIQRDGSAMLLNCIATYTVLHVFPETLRLTERGYDGEVLLSGNKLHLFYISPDGEIGLRNHFGTSGDSTLVTELKFENSLKFDPRYQKLPNWSNQGDIRCYTAFTWDDKRLPLVLFPDGRCVLYFNRLNFDGDKVKRVFWYSFHRNLACLGKMVLDEEFCVPFIIHLTGDRNSYAIYFQDDFPQYDVVAVDVTSVSLLELDTPSDIVMSGTLTVMRGRQESILPFIIRYDGTYQVFFKDDFLEGKQVEVKIIQRPRFLESSKDVKMVGFVRFWESKSDSGYVPFVVDSEGKLTLYSSVAGAPITEVGSDFSWGPGASGVFCIKVRTGYSWLPFIRHSNGDGEVLFLHDRFNGLRVQNANVTYYDEADSFTCCGAVKWDSRWLPFLRSSKYGTKVFFISDHYEGRMVTDTKITKHIFDDEDGTKLSGCEGYLKLGSDRIAKFEAFVDGSFNVHSIKDAKSFEEYENPPPPPQRKGRDYYRRWRNYRPSI